MKAAVKEADSRFEVVEMLHPHPKGIERTVQRDEPEDVSRANRNVSSQVNRPRSRRRGTPSEGHHQRAGDDPERPRQRAKREQPSPGVMHANRTHTDDD